MRTLVRLEGCRPEPMASYLKALGVLRLVSEQADSAARGFWDGNVFCLESELDEGALVGFFLERYRPTPIIAPWNAGAGFYEGEPTEALDAILATSSERFGLYRDTIRTVCGFPEMPPGNPPISELLRRLEVSPSKKSDAKLVSDVRAGLDKLSLPTGALALTVRGFEAWKKSLPKSSDNAKTAGKVSKSLGKLQTAAKKIGGRGKEEIVRACRNRLCDAAVDWIDAALVLRPGRGPECPAILGTGGNDGNQNFTRTFMDCLREVLIEGSPAAGHLLRNGLFGEPTSGLVTVKVGQYDPGRAGGFNQGPGIENKRVPTNPWNFVLALEGCVAWASGVARRQGVGARAVACSPFTVEPRAVGYASASDKDSDATRGAEVWMPIWHRSAPYEELRCLLREGRAEIGRKEARDGLQFAEAVASLGVDRGITSFVRYSLLERRGNSYVAVPTARFPVRAWRETDLLRDLDPLFAEPAPARLAPACRGVEQAIYQFLLHGGRIRFQAIVAALGRLEQRGDSQRPAFSLRPEWLIAADDGTPEFRIAASLASIYPSGDVGPLRTNLERHSKQGSWNGNSLARRLASVVQRRLMDAERLNSDASPLRSALAVHPQDVASFLSGSTDDARLEDLLFGLTVVRWVERDAIQRVRQALAWPTVTALERIPRSWALLKHLFLPYPIRCGDGEEIAVRGEPTLVPLLCAGRVGEACRIARRRLLSAGLNPISADFPDGDNGVRVAAALLIPVTAVQEISRLVLANVQHENVTT